MSKLAPFTPQQLLQTLRQWSQVKRFWIAYSGGLDSHVLLHAIASLRDFLPGIHLSAIHIDHGLSPHSAQWSQHCQNSCADLGVACRIIKVNAHPTAGESPEAAARAARYRAFTDIIGKGDCLLTAHHQDDQAETLLLQLIRGSGPAGLASMPAYACFGPGSMARPLLAWGREQLWQYGKQHQLKWVEDQSNFDTGFNRNFLRHEIMPKLKSRWPSIAKTLSRAAGHQAEAAHLLRQLAQQDLQEVAAKGDTLSVSALLRLNDERCRNMLRHWIKSRDLPLPDTSRLDQIISQMLTAPQDAEPLVHWKGCEVRRYRDALYAMLPLPSHDPVQKLVWVGSEPLVIPDIGILYGEVTIGTGINPEFFHHRHIEVGFRVGGEKCRPSGRRPTHALKKLFQDKGVPPWQRDRIPLIFIDGNIAAVVGYWICHGYETAADQPGVTFILKPNLAQ